MDNGKPTIEEINTLEYYTIRSELPSEYIGTETIENVPHNVRAAAWSRLLTRARAGNEEFRRSTIEKFYKIWNYRHSHQGFNMNDDVIRNMLNLAYMSSGSGNYYNTLQPFLYSLDKYNSIRIAENVEYNGPMFMTRPRLCLQTSNLRNHRVMSALDTASPNSMAFMIRALLDTNLHKHRIERQTYIEAYTKSLIFNYRCPFMTPLCNAAASITGLPDLVIETATTAGGFMAEAQQFAIGGDNLHRASYELNITFKDTQHSPIFAILYYWLEYIRCVTRGYMLAYADDIDQQRINYTVSIYLFNLDPSRKYITKWCKCTGCFSKSLAHRRYVVKRV